MPSIATRANVPISATREVALKAVPGIPSGHVYVRLSDIPARRVGDMVVDRRMLG